MTPVFDPINPQIIKTISETAFQDMIIQFAKWRGWHVVHFRPAQTGKGYRTPLQGDPGFPDLVLARDGATLFYELKRETGEPTTAQISWVSAIGGKARIYRPRDWQTIQKELW